MQVWELWKLDPRLPSRIEAATSARPNKQTREHTPKCLSKALAESWMNSISGQKSKPSYAAHIQDMKCLSKQGVLNQIQYELVRQIDKWIRMDSLFTPFHVHTICVAPIQSSSGWSMNSQTMMQTGSEQWGNYHSNSEQGLWECFLALPESSGFNWVSYLGSVGPQMNLEYFTYFYIHVFFLSNRLPAAGWGVESNLHDYVTHTQFQSMMHD